MHLSCNYDKIPNKEETIKKLIINKNIKVFMNFNCICINNSAKIKSSNKDNTKKKKKRFCIT